MVGLGPLRYSRAELLPSRDNVVGRPPGSTNVPRLPLSHRVARRVPDGRGFASEPGDGRSSENLGPPPRRFYI